MGSKPNLSAKQSVTIDTMINFDGDGDGLKCVRDDYQPQLIRTDLHTGKYIEHVRDVYQPQLNQSMCYIQVSIGAVHQTGCFKRTTVHSVCVCVCVCVCD